MSCSQCKKELTLYEKDERKGWMIYRCDSCALYYHYKRGWGDKWKLVKTSKLIYMTEKAAR